MFPTLARTLRHAPAYAALVIGTVALATGVSAGTYSAFAAVRRPESPYSHPERLFVISGVGDGAHGNLRPFHNLLRLSQSYTPLREQWFVARSRELVASPARARDRSVARVEPAFFRQFSKQPLSGRYLSSVDTLSDQPRTALISAALWRSEFEGAHLGNRLVSVDGVSYFVVGVTPDGADHLMAVDVWLPASRRDFESAADTWNTLALAVARPDAHRPQLETSLRTVAERLRAEFGSGRRAFRFIVLDGVAEALPLSDFHRALMAATAALVAIAIANLASLAHARVARRGPLFAVQRALGASRARVIRDVLAESALLATIGGALGAVVFVLSVGALRRLIPAHAPLIGDLRLQVDFTLFCFSLALAVVVALLFAAGPAVRAATTQPDRLLRSASIAHPSRMRPLQAGLVALQVSIALALLYSSALAFRGARRASLVADHSQLNGLVEVNVGLTTRGAEGDVATAKSDFQNIEEAFRKGAGTAPSAWWAWPRRSGLALEGTSAVGDRRTVFRPSLRAVSWDYLAAVGAPVILGRDFLPGDSDGPPLAIVDERTSHELWPHESPLGRQVSIVQGAEREWATVVGVVRSQLNQGDSFDAFIPGRASIYLAGASTASERQRVFVARLESHDDGRAIADLESRVRDASPAGARTMVDVPADAPERIRSAYAFISLLFTIFAGVAVALAMLGLYASLATATQASRRDRAIRLALGARPRALASAVARQGLTMILAGMAIGAFFAMAGSGLVDPFIYDLYRIDPSSLIAAEVALLLFGFLAAWAPVRWALTTSAQDIARST